MPEIVPVMCHMQCEGLRDLCLMDIRLIVEDGDIAFMLYSQHVVEKVKSYGYKVIANFQNGIPIGMYVMLKNVEFPVKI